MVQSNNATEPHGDRPVVSGERGAAAATGRAARAESNSESIAVKEPAARVSSTTLRTLLRSEAPPPPPVPTAPPPANMSRRAGAMVAAECRSLRRSEWDQDCRTPRSQRLRGEQ